MAKRKVEEELQQLDALRRLPVADATIGALWKALGDRVNVIVAQGAKVAAELGCRALVPDILAAFERLFVDPVKNDPQCWGKNALSKALKDLGHAEARPFLKGLRHVQREPVWGGQEDTATVLRGACALALLQCTDITVREILTHLVDAVTDAGSTVRRDAALALAQMGSSEAILLLRLKARAGDKEASVTGEILEALLRLEEEQGVEFVGGFLDHAEMEVREEAALALGACRVEPAIALLGDRWLKPHAPEMAEVLIRGLGASRLESAIHLLIEIVRTGRSAEALAALHSLAPVRDGGRIWDEVAQAVGERGDEAIRLYFDEHFGVAEPE